MQILKFRVTLARVFFASCLLAFCFWFAIRLFNPLDAREFLSPHLRRNQEVMEIIRDAKESGKPEIALTALRQRIAELRKAIRQIEDGNYWESDKKRVRRPIRMKLEWAERSVWKIEEAREEARKGAERGVAPFGAQLQTIQVRGRTIKVGDLADDVFSILTRISFMNYRRQPSE